jgi:transglutaminase-like putative cysteine protease
MGSRLGWIAAIAALALAVARLSRLLSSGPTTVDWTLILLAGLALGGIATAGAVFAGLNRWWLIPLNTVGAGLMLLRIAAGQTLVGGILPTAATWPAAGEELATALELIRYGTAPVIAATGLVAVLAALFWVLGALAAGGIAYRNVGLMVVPPLAFYLVLATLDRAPTNMLWPVGLGVAVALALLAASRQRLPAGRARSSDTGRTLRPAARGLAMTVTILLVVVAAGVTRTFAATVPESGLVSWRNPSGFAGGLFGGFTFNLFTSMQQDLSSNSPQQVFVARVSDDAPDNSQLYWRLLTLDVYDGTYWLPGDLSSERPRGAGGWEATDFAWQGASVQIEQVVLIQGLRQNLLPHIYAPVAMESDEPLLADSFRVREDGAIQVDARTQEGMLYRIRSNVPVPDLAMLATISGRLSPIFESAAAAGASSLAPIESSPPATSARLRSQFTALPDDFPAEIGTLARQVTARAGSDFERALLLERYFRSSNLFTYSTSVSSGHAALELVDWLLDPESRNYHTGYCEQFATAMAVMGRALGIPSRVVLGFTPGELTTQGDGSQLVVVRARNAHAWVEMYMAGQGWVRFDPTPRGDGVNRGTVEDLGFDPALYLPEPATTGTTVPGIPVFPGFDFSEDFLGPGFGDLPVPEEVATGGWEWLWLIAGLAAVIGSIPVAKFWRRRRRIRQLGEGDVMAAWEEITDRLRDLGLGVDLARTPVETAVSVDRFSMLPLAERLGASIYGDLPVADGVEVFRTAELALKRAYPGRRWMASWLNPGSLVARTYRAPAVSERIASGDR